MAAVQAAVDALKGRDDLVGAIPVLQQYTPNPNKPIVHIAMSLWWVYHCTLCAVWVCFFRSCVVPRRSAQRKRAYQSLYLFKGAFNNYVDKKRWTGAQQNMHIASCDKGQIVSKMSILVHSRSVGGQNWVKFGTRSC